MAFGTVRTPAVGFATAGIDLGEGTSEQGVKLEELIEQIATPLLEPADSSPQKSA